MSVRVFTATPNGNPPTGIVAAARHPAAGHPAACGGAITGTRPALAPTGASPASVAAATTAVRAIRFMATRFPRPGRADAAVTLCAGSDTLSYRLLARPTR